MEAPITVEAAVGLGSNLGDRLAHLREAPARIPALAGVGTVWSSPPPGWPSAPRKVRVMPPAFARASSIGSLNSTSSDGTK